MDEAVFRLVDPLEEPDGVACMWLRRAGQERGDGSAGRVEEEGGGEEPHPARRRRAAVL